MTATLLGLMVGTGVVGAGILIASAILATRRLRSRVSKLESVLLALFVGGCSMVAALPQEQWLLFSWLLAGVCLLVVIVSGYFLLVALNQNQARPEPLAADGMSLWSAIGVSLIGPGILVVALLQTVRFAGWGISL